MAWMRPCAVVPVDGLGDVAVAKRCQGLALFGVVLAAVLGQVMDGAGVAGDQGAEGAPGADRAELAVVAEKDSLAPAASTWAAEADQVDVVGHPDLVEDHHRLFAELQLIVVEPPDQAGQGPRLGDPGLGPRLRAAWPEVAVPSTW